jgi:hypothetical protein
MSLINEVLEKFGLKEEDLDTPGHSGEMETLLKMQQTIQKNQVSVERTRAYVSSLREEVTKQLVDEPEFNYIFIFKVPNRKQIFLKARLKNYMLLEAYLSSPERMKQEMEDMVSVLAGK